MTVNEVINTLAKDETNPEVNKKAIVELGKAIDGSGGSKLYKHSILLSDGSSRYSCELLATTKNANMSVFMMSGQYMINIDNNVFVGVISGGSYIAIELIKNSMGYYDAYSKALSNGVYNYTKVSLTSSYTITDTVTEL